MLLSDPQAAVRLELSATIVRHKGTGARRPLFDEDNKFELDFDPQFFLKKPKPKWHSKILQ